MSYFLAFLDGWAKFLTVEAEIFPPRRMVTRLQKLMVWLLFKLVNTLYITISSH